MRYLLGVAAALLVGIVFNAAALMQKVAVRRADHSKPLMGQLLRDPYWLGSVLGSVVIVLPLTLAGQMAIGPTLIPGIAAIGMILLPFGAARFAGEKNGIREYLGISAIILGVICLGSSRLSIETEKVQWLDPGFLRLTLLYVGSLSAAALLCAVSGSVVRRGSLLLIISSGFLYAMSNIAVSPVSYQFSQLVREGVSGTHMPYLIISTLYFLLVNAAAVVLTQRAFTSGDVSKLIPVQQVPIQLVPIILHFGLFGGTLPDTLSLVVLIPGVMLILVGASVLGRKEAVIEGK